jgi:DNA repair ATPase RecN
MRTPRLLLFATLLFGVALVGCGGPEDQIVGHIESINDILEDNLDDPADGVEEVESYLIENLGDIASAASELLVELYEIDDEGDAKERLQEIKDTVEEAMNEFKKTAMKFDAKVRGDEDAREAMQRIEKRFQRLYNLARLLD